MTNYYFSARVVITAELRVFPGAIVTKRARTLVESVQHLKGPNWDQIEAHASTHFQGADNNNDKLEGMLAVPALMCMLRLR
jgi:hypothetical protein